MPGVPLEWWHPLDPRPRVRWFLHALRFHQIVTLHVPGKGVAFYCATCAARALEEPVSDPGDVWMEARTTYTAWRDHILTCPGAHPPPAPIYWPNPKCCAEGERLKEAWSNAAATGDARRLPLRQRLPSVDGSPRR